MDDNDPTKCFIPLSRAPKAAANPNPVDPSSANGSEKTPEIVRSPDEEVAERQVKTSKFRI